jgi:hypothetical protein
MTRLQQILVIVLIIQIALGVFIFWPQSAVQGASGPLLPDFTPADVVSLTIQGDGNRLNLAKNAGNWVLPEAGNYPADGEKVLPFLEKIEAAQTNRLVTQTEASHKRLKVAPDDFNRLIEMTLQDDSMYQLYLGNSGGGSATHVRVDGQSEVYLTDAVQAFEANPQASAWIDTLYFTVPQTATVALTLENENGTFEFEKEGENWTMQGLAEDETFKESGLTTLLNQATSVRMTRPIGKEEQPSFGLDAPLATVTLKTLDNDQEKTYTLRIGAKNEDDNNYVVSSSESPYYVWVAEFTGNNFVQKTRDDFLELPPTPEGGTDTSDSSGSE